MIHQDSELQSSVSDSSIVTMLETTEESMEGDNYVSFFLILSSSHYTIHTQTTTHHPALYLSHNPFYNYIYVYITTILSPHSPHPQAAHELRRVRRVRSTQHAARMSSLCTPIHKHHTCTLNHTLTSPVKALSQIAKRGKSEKV